MFSFFAWFSLIGGICGTAYNLYMYAIMYQRDPWDIDNSTYLLNAIIILFVSLIVFAFYLKLKNMEKEIDNLARDVRNLYLRKPSSEKIERKDDSKEIEKIKTLQQLELSDKLDSNLKNVEKSDDANIKNTLMAPLDWPEFQLAQKDAKLALFSYFDAALPILLSKNAHFSVVGEACNEAYRITGSVGDRLSGKNSEIMSYMCDCEQRTNGRSEALRKMCKKLDSIGLLDRGRPFSDRLN